LLPPTSPNFLHHHKTDFEKNALKYRDKNFFYCCTVHLDNIKIIFTKECTFYLTYEMLKFTVKTSIYSPLLVSVPLGPSSWGLFWSVTLCTALNTQNSLKHMLPQQCITFNDVFYG
jgi:hypothetical protein